jgi:hypothetical protein
MWRCKKAVGKRHGERKETSREWAEEIEAGKEIVREEREGEGNGLGGSGGDGGYGEDDDGEDGKNGDGESADETEEEQAEPILESEQAWWKVVIILSLIMMAEPGEDSEQGAAADGEEAEKESVY